MLALSLLLSCTQNPMDSADTAQADTAQQSSGEYRFESDGQDSVSYSGQTFRHLLIVELGIYLEALTGRIDAGYFPQPGQVQADLGFYLAYDPELGGQVPLSLTTDPAPLQSTFGEISSKNLLEKLAGNDPTGQHRDWTGGEFQGWPDAQSPQALIEQWAAQIDAQAVAWSLGELPLDPSGAPVASVYITAQGQDLRQLMLKLLTGGVAYSQGSDDYLDDDLLGEGLNSPHDAQNEGANYTELEHAWDEAFGYFGAARSYGDWSDAEIKALTQDRDQDGHIDLGQELCWGHSVNASKRDLGAVVATDFSGQAWTAFVDGRALLSRTAGSQLDEGERQELEQYRDQALEAWELSLAATTVHYINEMIVDIEAQGSETYAFEDQAKHFSEAKGFALSLQFNPRSALSPQDISELHLALGTAPLLPGASPELQDAEIQTLLSARALLEQRYGFDPANMGDAHGLQGW